MDMPKGHNHAVLIIKCTPESVNTGPLICPTYTHQNSRCIMCSLCTQQQHGGHSALGQGNFALHHIQTEAENVGVYKHNRRPCRVCTRITRVPSGHMWLLQMASASGQDQTRPDHHRAWRCCSDSPDLLARQSLTDLTSAVVETAESLPRPPPVSSCRPVKAATWLRPPNTAGPTQAGFARSSQHAHYSYNHTWHCLNKMP